MVCALGDAGAALLRSAWEGAEISDILGKTAFGGGSKCFISLLKNTWTAGFVYKNGTFLLNVVLVL
jgi:hypothetical protein